MHAHGIAGRHRVHRELGDRNEGNLSQPLLRSLGGWALAATVVGAAPALAGPYAPAAGQAGSTAIAHNSPQFVAWASGYANYLPGPNVTSPWNSPAEALGPATTDNFDIVSLGDSGQITLTFATAIGNGTGADFAVFENSLNDTFLELAFVEVSDGGSTFFRFPNASLTANPVPFIGGSVDTTNIDGLAGKYRLGYGTPFDLSAVGLAKATHVRLVDVLGNGTVFDSSNRPIYDPTPTSGSGGFDLEAVGVINLIPEPSALALAPLGLLAARRRRV